MANNKKKISIILAVVLIIVAVGTALVFFITNEHKKSKTAETIMSVSVNPSVQLVLNKKGKVIDARATNEDGDKLLVKVDFTGLTADEAAELFVKTSTEAGFIDVSSTEGTKVTINLIGNKEDYSKIQNKIKTKVNTYFDENGIVAGVVTKVDDNIKTALDNISATVENFDDKTKAELIEIYANHVEKTKGVVYSQQEALYSKYESLKEIFENDSFDQLIFSTLKATITTIKASIQVQSEEMASKLEPVFEIAKVETYEELQKALDKARKHLDGIVMDETIKTGIDKILTGAQKTLEDMKEKYETAKSKFEEDFKKAIDNAITKSNEYRETIKADVEKMFTEGTNKLNERKTYYEANKAEVQQKIAQFRQTLSNT
ncbi:MAG: hypothetical protein IJX17_03225 [Clostridia bacterium]|nr:hypothetical protein [Clostridia bacterium]